MGSFFAQQVLLTLVLTPVILHFIGTEAYGVYSLAFGVVSLLSFLKLGMDTTIVRFLSASLAASDLGAARSIAGVGLTFYLTVGVVGASLTAVLGQLLARTLSLSPDVQASASFVFLAAGGWFLLLTLQPPVVAIPAALQRFDIEMTARMIAGGAFAIASVVVLSLGFGVRGLVVLVALQEGLVLSLIIPRTRRLIPEFRLRPAYNAALLKKMMPFSGYTFVSNLGGVVLFQLDKIVLGALTNASAVTYYVIPANVASYLNVLATRLAYTTLPFSTDLHVRGVNEELRRFYIRTSRLLVLLVMTFAVPGFIFAHEILLHWLGSSFATRSTDPLRLLILTYGLLSLFALPYFLTLSFGRPQIPAVFNVATAALNAVLIFVLIPSYGIIGAAVAYLASTMTVPGAIVYVERRLLGLGSSHWPRLLVRLSPVLAGQIVACLLLRPRITGLTALAGVLLLSVATAPALALLTGYLTSEDRATIRRLASPRRAARMQ